MRRFLSASSHAVSGWKSGTNPRPLRASEEIAACEVTTSTSAGGFAKARHGGIIGVAQRGADHPPAVVRLLVIALDIPGRIVGDDEHRPGAVAHGRVDLHGIDPESAITVDGNNLPARERKRRRDRERHADAEAAK